MADGIINVPVCADRRHLTPAFERNAPVVLIDRALQDIADKLDSVLIDNEGAAHTGGCSSSHDGAVKVAVGWYGVR